MTNNQKKEDVLVVSRPDLSMLNMERDFCLVESCHSKYVQLESLLKKSVFRDRASVEEDKSWVQIIPYTIVHKCALKKSEDGILVYNRGTKGGEKRLSDYWSLGVGGHINTGDSKYPHTIGIEDLYEGARVELKEELLGISDLNLSNLRLQGLIYNEDTPVSSVHLGVVFLLELNEDSFSGMGDYISNYRYVEYGELKDMNLEKWSELAMKHFIPRILGISS